MATAARYPVHLAIAGQPVLVVGGGHVAERRARTLSASGACVTVVAPAIRSALRALDGITLQHRRYAAGEAGGYRLVVAATDDPEVNRQVCADAEAVNVWANDASSPDGGAFATPAVLRRGSVVISVGTGGTGPGLAVWLRDQIADLLGPEVGVLAELVGEERRAARTDAPTDVLPDWRPALDSGMLDLIRHGRILEAKERLSACRSSSSG